MSFPGFEPRLSPEPYIGKKLEEAETMAKQAGGSIRVVGQDGRCVDALADNLDSTRLNVYLTDGRVTDAAAF